MGVNGCLIILPSIRFAPPLVITEADLDKAVCIIESCLNDLDTVDVIPFEVRPSECLSGVILDLITALPYAQHDDPDHHDGEREDASVTL